MILSAERRAGEIEGRNVGEEHRRDEGEGARREQTLMPPCRPQMLHQLQTSSFLRSPSFPSSRPSQIEKERQGDICRIQTYHIPLHSPSLPLFFLPLRPSAFHSHLSAVSQPAPGAMTLVIRRRKEGRRHTVDTVETAELNETRIFD